MKKTIILLACVMAGTLGHAQTKEKAPPPPPPLPPKVEMVKFSPPVIVNDEELKEFYERNPTVSKISWQGKQTVILLLKDSKKEKYNMADEKQKKAFTDKYGEAPEMAPPPPPPAPPTPPAAMKEVQ